jgi:glycosyltransferase involved in cell wall biosynthesis
MKVMFLMPHPIEIGSARQRVYRYVPYLEKHDIHCYVSSFVTSRFHKFVYSRGRLLKKIVRTGNGCLHRIQEVATASDYDVIFIQREAFPFGTTWVEKRLSRKRPIIYDFDDAIYLMNPAKSSLVPFLRKPSKIARIIQLSEQVIAGNQYLADYARKFNKNINIIPTSINTDYYTPGDSASKRKEIVIGWIGSRTTISYLSVVLEALQRVAKKYDIVLKIIANATIDLPVKTEFKRWSLSDEREDLRSIDIGVMPLPDNEWTRAKCGYKIIQYMAVGKPVIASPVGVNNQIITDGENGFLAKDPKEWENKISALIEKVALRETLGQRGRQTVVENYSIQVNAPKMLSIMNRFKVHY